MVRFEASDSLLITENITVILALAPCFQKKKGKKKEEQRFSPVVRFFFLLDHESCSKTRLVL